MMVMNIESVSNTTLQCELIRNTHRAVHPRGHPNSGAVISFPVRIDFFSSVVCTEHRVGVFIIN